MPPVNVLIKPASSACNMNCAYCFYKDVAQNRETECQGPLSIEMMEQVIVSAMEGAEGACTFAFQGGEPTLRGLDFYKSVVELQKKHAKPGVRIHNSIQTNGYLVDDDWAKFFAENKFLVGLSLDGPADLHNLNRVDHHGKGTFNRVMRAVQLFNKWHVDYNILCVITGKNARSAEKIYKFFRKQHFRWLQFIPCLEPLEQDRGSENYHLSIEEYGAFLIRIFDLWFEDFQNGNYVSIRHLDNWLSILMGHHAEACNAAGHCSVQFVIEGDGDVYPCDFYVLDEWRLGQIGEMPLSEMFQSPAAQKFIQDSLHIPTACKGCRFYGLCRNGCRRDRLILSNGTIDQNYYCQAYKTFFHAKADQLMMAADRILRNTCPCM